MYIKKVFLWAALALTATATLTSCEDILGHWEKPTPATGPIIIDLSTITTDYTATNGETLSGTLAGNVKISIAAGATITLKDVTINGTNSDDCQWAGITCAGDATIILEGTNTVKGFFKNYPGIYVPSGNTLTIQGTGSLDASSNGFGAGIGGGLGIPCGNITISGGTITATGSANAAGIGGGDTSSCGTITISGGTVEAIGGANAAGIGGGNSNGPCGDITITSGVTSVLVAKGSDAPNTIGEGKGGTAITKNIETGANVRTMVNLATITADYPAADGETLSGTLAANVKISIADGATVTLKNVTINGTNDNSYQWAGITCEGVATIILAGTNTVKGFHEDYPGIHANELKTLTIQGTGSLDASSNGKGAGIGGGYFKTCGIIVINSGTINARGGENAAGIGGGGNASYSTITINGGTINATGGANAAGIGSGGSGNGSSITISGGTVTATGGEKAPGIGCGASISGSAACGNITVESTVTSVTATKGTDAPKSIGKGKLEGSYSPFCGTVTIGGTVYAGGIADSPYTYKP